MSNMSNSQVREDSSDKATLKKRLKGNYSHMVLHMAGVGGNRNSLPRNESHSNLCWPHFKIIDWLYQLKFLLMLPSCKIAIFGLFWLFLNTIFCLVYATWESFVLSKFEENSWLTSNLYIALKNICKMFILFFTITRKVYVSLRNWTRKTKCYYRFQCFYILTMFYFNKEDVCWFSICFFT